MAVQVSPPPRPSPPPRLVLDQSEAQRAKKEFFLDPRHPLSEGLDPLLNHVAYEMLPSE